MCLDIVDWVESSLQQYLRKKIWDFVPTNHASWLQSTNVDLLRSNALMRRYYSYFVSVPNCCKGYLLERFKDYLFVFMLGMQATSLLNSYTKLSTNVKEIFGKQQGYICEQYIIQANIRLFLTFKRFDDVHNVVFLLTNHFLSSYYYILPYM